MCSPSPTGAYSSRAKFVCDVMQLSVVMAWLVERCRLQHVAPASPDRRDDVYDVTDCQLTARCVSRRRDSRSERSPPVVEPGSPRRRSRKRNPPADIRIGELTHVAADVTSHFVTALRRIGAAPGRNDPVRYYVA